MTNIQNYDDALAFIHGRTKFKKDSNSETDAAIF